MKLKRTKITRRLALKKQVRFWNGTKWIHIPRWAVRGILGVSSVEVDDKGIWIAERYSK